MRINSGTAIVGCVSFSWMATFSGKRAPIVVVAAEAAHEIGQRAGDEEVFLHEAQRLAHAGGIVGIEHAGDRLGSQRLRQCADEIAAAEFAGNQSNRARRRPTGEAC